LLARKIVPVLDATPAGHTVYLGLGFRDGWTMQRLIGRTPRTPDTKQDAATVRALAASDWPQLVDYDAAVLGASRGALLHRLAQRLPHAALVADQGGKIVGFLLGRDGRVMNQLGPLVATDESVAEALLARAIAAVPGPLAIDVPDRHTALSAWLATLGFTAERPLTRMMYGTKSTLGDSARLFAIAGPELG
jgi:hypothetical protein